MKKLLLTAIYFMATFMAMAQAPVIEGDTMLCPWTEGTVAITGDGTYDSYQWYYRYWFDTEFVAIDGATEPSFTYDWYTYDQAVFKVEVTKGEEVYESNTIQIDSHAWASMTVMGETSHVTFDPDTESWLLCEGGTFENTVNSPYTANIQWYRNDDPIDGATGATYAISEPGTYYVRASPFMCTQEENMGQSLPIVVAMDPDCTMGIDNPEANSYVGVYPNPAHEALNLQLHHNHAFTSYTVIDVTGKILMDGTMATPAVNVSALAAGTYILKLTGGGRQAIKRFIKE